MPWLISKELRLLQFPVIKRKPINIEVLWSESNHPIWGPFIWYGMYAHEMPTPLHSHCLVMWGMTLASACIYKELHYKGLKKQNKKTLRPCGFIKSVVHPNLSHYINEIIFGRNFPERINVQLTGDYCTLCYDKCWRLAEVQWSFTQLYVIRVIFCDLVREDTKIIVSQIVWISILSTDI